MARCPECGGIMKSVNRRLVCTSCGISLSRSEWDRLKEKIRFGAGNPDDDKRSKRHKEYLKWYLDSKEKV